MEINYTGFLAFWYNSWIVLLGFTGALGVTVLMMGRGGWGSGALLLKTLMVVALLAALPLTLMRLGMDLAMRDVVLVGWLSVLGVAGSLVVGSLIVGLPYIYARRSGSLGEAEAPEPEYEGIVTPEAGAPTAPEAEGGTMTLGSAPAPAAADGEATLVGGAPQGPDQAPGDMATQAPPAWLLFKSGPRAGQSIPLSPGATSIGRSPDNDVVVDDDAVSRRHANIN